MQPGICWRPIPTAKCCACSIRYPSCMRRAVWHPSWRSSHFPRQQVRNAALLVLELWIQERGGVEAQEDQEAVETIRGFIQVNQFRFITIALMTRAVGGTPHQACRISSGEESIFAHLSHGLEAEACSGLDEKQVADKLVAAGYLHAEMSCGRISKIARKIMIGRQRQRLVCISETILGVGDADIKETAPFIDLSHDWFRHRHHRLRANRNLSMKSRILCTWKTINGNCEQCQGYLVVSRVGTTASAFAN